MTVTVENVYSRPSVSKAFTLYMFTTSVPFAVVHISDQVGDWHAADVFPGRLQLLDCRVCCWTRQREGYFGPAWVVSLNFPAGRVGGVTVAEVIVPTAVGPSGGADGAVQPASESAASTDMAMLMGYFIGSPNEVVAPHPNPYRVGAGGVHHGGMHRFIWDGVTHTYLTPHHQSR